MRQTLSQVKMHAGDARGHLQPPGQLWPLPLPLSWPLSLPPPWELESGLPLLQQGKRIFSAMALKEIPKRAGLASMIACQKGDIDGSCHAAGAVLPERD